MEATFSLTFLKFVFATPCFYRGWRFVFAQHYRRIGLAYPCRAASPLNNGNHFQLDLFFPTSVRLGFRFDIQRLDLLLLLRLLLLLSPATCLDAISQTNQQDKPINLKGPIQSTSQTNELIQWTDPCLESISQTNQQDKSISQISQQDKPINLKGPIQSTSQTNEPIQSTSQTNEPINPRINESNEPNQSQNQWIQWTDPIPESMNSLRKSIRTRLSNGGGP